MLTWYGSNGAHQGNHKLEKLLISFYWCRNVAWPMLLFVICFFLVLIISLSFCIWSSNSICWPDNAWRLDSLLLPFTSYWKFQSIISSWKVVLPVQCPRVPWNISPDDYYLLLISWIIYSDILLCLKLRNVLWLICVWMYVSNWIFLNSFVFFNFVLLVFDDLPVILEMLQLPNTILLYIV